MRGPNAWSVAGLPLKGPSGVTLGVVVLWPSGLKAAVTPAAAGTPVHAQVIETLAGVFKRPIVTQVNQLTGFYPAEAYHQDYATLHPSSPYIAFNDLPKVDNLQRVFADIYRDKPVLVSAASQSN